MSDTTSMVLLLWVAYSYSSDKDYFTIKEYRTLWHPSQTLPLDLSQASSIQFCFSKIHFKIILSGFVGDFILQYFINNILYEFLVSTLYAGCSVNFSILGLNIITVNFRWKVQILSFSLLQIFHFPVAQFLLGPYVIFCTFFWNTYFFHSQSERLIFVTI